MIQIIKEHQNQAPFLGDQIVSEARKMAGGPLSYDFKKVYRMRRVVFFVGKTTIGGVAHGQSEVKGRYLYVHGTINFYLNDMFVDPLDIGKEVVDPAATYYENILLPLEQDLRRRAGLRIGGKPRRGIITGTPYALTDRWSGSFSGVFDLE